MKHKVKSVSPIPYSLVLEVNFCDGTTKTYDVERLFDKWPCFRVLAEDRQLFCSVRVDTGGYGIVWNDDLDLSCDELYENGITQS